MRFTLSEAMCDIAHYLPLARAADEAGFHTFALGDSVLYPREAKVDYPYTEDGDRSFLEGAPFLDPFQLFAAMSVVTTRIEFTTGVLKLPIRNPVLVAKQVSSLACLTGERFVLGVGLSPWPEDFEACGEDWATRGERMDEMIAIIRALLGGGYVSWDSEHYRFPDIKLCPVPEEPLRVVIGGHSKAALRRAARLADGFNFTGIGEEELLERIATLRALRGEYGRQDEPFAVYAGLATIRTPDDMRRIEDEGVTDLFVGYRNPYLPDRMTLQQKVDWVKNFGDRVISKL